MPPSLPLQCFLFSFLGLGLEVAFTAALDSWKRWDRFLMGYSSIWYIPLYAVVPFILSWAGPSLFPIPWYLRGLIYMVACFVLEFAGMGALRLILGASPSEASYYKARWNVLGLIRLDWAPVWFCAGLLFETLFRALNPT